MPTRFDRYDDLLHRVYDCALAPHLWPATLGTIADVFDARRVVLWTFMHGADRGGIFYTHNLDEAVVAAWASISPAEDPFVRGGLSRNLLIDGSAYAASDLAPHAEVVQSRLYRDLWVPYDIGDVCAGIIFAGTDGLQLPTAITLYRSPRDSPFDAGEVGMLRRLVAHLSRALGVMFHLQDQAHQIAASRAALNRLGAGVVLLDGRGHVQFANAAAEALLRRGDQVRRTSRDATQRTGSPRSGRLAIASGSPEIRAAFTKAIAAAIEPQVDGQGDDEHFAESLVLPDEHGRPAVVMNAAPLGSAPAFAEGGVSARAIVFFHELNRRGAVPPERLSQIFGLTQAEARAALQLLEGGSTQDMADRLGISVNTLKTQMKAAYAKTHTNRQAGLLRVMLALDGV